MIYDAGTSAKRPEFTLMKEFVESTVQDMGYVVVEMTTLQVLTEDASTTTVEGYFILNAPVDGILLTLVKVIVYRAGLRMV